MLSIIVMSVYQKSDRLVATAYRKIVDYEDETCWDRPRFLSAHCAFIAQANCLHHSGANSFAHPFL